MAVHLARRDRQLLPSDGLFDNLRQDEVVELDWRDVEEDPKP